MYGIIERVPLGSGSVFCVRRHSLLVSRIMVVDDLRMHCDNGVEKLNSDVEMIESR